MLLIYSEIPLSIIYLSYFHLMQGFPLFQCMWMDWIVGGGTFKIPWPAPLTELQRSNWRSYSMEIVSVRLLSLKGRGKPLHCLFISIHPDFSCLLQALLASPDSSGSSVCSGRGRDAAHYMGRGPTVNWAAVPPSESSATNRHSSTFQRQCGGVTWWGLSQRGRGGGRVRVYKSSETRSSGHVRRTYLHRKVRSSSADSSIGHRSYWDMAERNIPFTVHRSPSWDPWHQVSRLFDQGFGMPPLNEDFSTFPNAHWPGYVRAPFMSPEMGALLHHPPHTVHPSHLMGHRALSRQLSSGLSEIKQTQDNWKVALDVSHFSPEELVVKTKDGILEISGENPFMSIKSNLCSYALVKGCDWDPNTVHVSEQWVSPAEKHLQLYEQRTLLVWFKKIHRIQWEGNFRSHWGRMHSWWTS